ncbi:MAG: hypothetical protein KGH79_00405 [Patescibacteria group bacterium]|nr:hypothetical protein [Patescibacteria group bacterium]
MQKRSTLFTLLAEATPPRGLYEAILARIEEAKRTQARVRSGIFGIVAVLSGAALVPAVQYALAQFYASGFYDYASLLLSDRSLALTYWREFSLTLLESLPALALLFVIPLVVALVWSLSRTIKTARVAFTYGNI